jgi:hypothetical protein
MWKYLTRNSNDSPYARLDEAAQRAVRRHITGIFGILIVVLLSDIAALVCIVMTGIDGWMIACWILGNCCAFRFGPRLINKRLARVASDNPQAFDASDIRALP